MLSAQKKHGIAKLVPRHRAFAMRIDFIEQLLDYIHNAFFRKFEQCLQPSPVSVSGMMPIVQKGSRREMSEGKCSTNEDIASNTPSGSLNLLQNGPRFT